MRLKQAYKQMSRREKKAFFAKIKKFFQDVFGGNESKKALDMLQDIWKNRESFSRDIGILRNDWKKYQREILSELFSGVFMSPENSAFAHILKKKKLDSKLWTLKKEINALKGKEEWTALRNVFTKELIPYVEKLQQEIPKLEKFFDDYAWDMYADMDFDVPKSYNVNIGWKREVWLPHIKKVKGKQLSKKELEKLGFDDDEAHDIFLTTEAYLDWEGKESTTIAEALDLIEKKIIPQTRKMTSTLSGLPDLEGGLQQFLEDVLPDYLKRYPFTASAKDLGDYIKKNIDDIAANPSIFGKDARKFFDMSKKLK